MPCELSLRRDEFSADLPVVLADGQTWMLPGPSALGDGGPEYKALLEAICRAEDGPELLRAELALAIYLLGYNYNLGPDDYAEVLECPSGGPGLVEMQRSFREAASAHAEQRGYSRPARRPAQAPSAGS